MHCAASEVGSTKNRVVTLRASASGRRGYRSQDLSTTWSSSVDSEISALPSGNIDTSDPSWIPPLDLESDTQPGSGTKSRPKQKNTTTVSYIGLFG